MGNPEEGPFSSLKAISRLSNPENQNLEETLEYAEEVVADFSPTKGYGSGRVNPADDLCVVLYHVEAPAGAVNNDNIEKLNNRLTKPTYVTSKSIHRQSGKKIQINVIKPNLVPATIKDVEKIYLMPGQMRIARANQIVATIKKNRIGFGIELSLVLDEECAIAQVFKSQSETLYTQAAKTNAGRRLPRAKQINPLYVPIANIPIAAEDKLQIQELLDVMRAVLPLPNLAFHPLVLISEKTDVVTD